MPDATPRGRSAAHLCAGDFSPHRRRGCWYGRHSPVWTERLRNLGPPADRDFATDVNCGSMETAWPTSDSWVRALHSS